MYGCPFGLALDGNILLARAGLLDDSGVENGRLQRVSMPLGHDPMIR